jgi:hypothetical protein
MVVRQKQAVKGMAAIAREMLTISMDAPLPLLDSTSARNLLIKGLSVSCYVTCPPEVVSSLKARQATQDENKL